MLPKFFKFQLTILVCFAIFSVWPLTSATDAVTEKVEDSTESPIADMAVIESEMKTSTERPPIMESAKQDEKPSSQRHTVADFIIHPLIAFKPRNPEEDVVPVVAKQAATSTSSTTPSPWQLFGFNAGQGLGSSVSSIAGSVTGWINDRIQLPGLMETPVRESTTSSTTSTTTTTPRPDVVVRVQHKPTTRRPLISINNRNRPNRPNFDSNENDDEDDFEENEDNDEIEDNVESSNEEGDGEGSYEKADGDNSEEEEDNEVVEKDESEGETEEIIDDDEEENYSQRPNNRRRPVRNKNNKRRGNIPQNTRRHIPNNRQRPVTPARRRPANINDESEEDVSNDDEYNDNLFYYGERPSTKRSQSNQNFLQRGQQQLINQIRQLTRVQTPAEIGSAIRRSQTNNISNRIRQQATLYVNRNGQTIYMSPELGQFGQPQYQSVYSQPIVHKQPASSVFPQPPLTVTIKQKGKPVQYITIPWSQLGISPPSNIVGITEGIQSQPFILNIPQSAINTMTSQARPGQANRKKKRPQLITSEAVPLLAEASLMDIFKPPQIPPSRTSNNSRPSLSGTHVFVAGKPSSTNMTPFVQQRIRPGTVVEKAQIMEDEKKPDDPEAPSADEPIIDVHRASVDNEYILVGKDDEPGLNRRVEPVYGDARYVRLTGNSQFYDVPRRRFTIRRGGRELNSEGETDKRIPVEVESEPEISSIPKDQQLNSKASETMPDKKEDKKGQNFTAKPLTLPLAPAEPIQNAPETT